MNNLTIEQRARIFQTAPEGYDWAAMDECFEWWAYDDKPLMVLFYMVWWPFGDADGWRLYDLDDIEIDWRHSLVTRPTDEEINSFNQK